jgi:hypothetical protein
MPRPLQRPNLLIIAMLILAAPSMAIFRNVASQGEISVTGYNRDQVLARMGAHHADTARTERPNLGAQSEPRLVLLQNVSGAADETIPLGAQISGGPVGLALEIHGLSARMTVTPGRRLGAGGWRIPATDLRDAAIHPPPGFSGAVDLAVELRLADDTIVDRGSVHRTWLRKSTASIVDSIAGMTVADKADSKSTTTPPPGNDQNANHSATASQIDREQIERLIGRSQLLLSRGDIAEARILLKRAAEARDARAARALGSTYDPDVLRRMGVVGVAPDVSVAREWYQKASEYGSREARQRLNVLTAATVDGGERVAVGLAEDRHDAEPETTAKDRVPQLPKPKRRVGGASINVETPPNDSPGVFVGGAHVGTDPDPNIRAQLLRAG